MTETTRYFNDGEPLTLQYSGNGDSVIVVSADTNEGIDREATIVLTGLSGAPVTSFTVQQPGLRELVYDATEELLLTADGTTLKALKTKP